MGLPLVGALLGGIGSIFSGFGAKKRQKAEKKMLMGMYADMKAEAQHAENVPLVQTQDSTVDLVAMRKAAEDAGFNAVSALRAGLGSSFARTVSTTTGHNAGLTANLIGQYLSSGNTPKEPTNGLEILGGAVSAGSSIFTDLTNKAIDQQIQMQSQAGYLKGLSNYMSMTGNGSGRAMFSVPSVITAGQAIRSIGGSGPLPSTRPNQKSLFQPTNSNDVFQPAKGEGPVLNLPFIGPVKFTNRSSGDDRETVLGDADLLNSIIAGGHVAESLDLNKRLSFQNVQRAAIGWLNDNSRYALNRLGSEITNWGKLLTPGAGKQLNPSSTASWTMQNGRWVPTGR